MERPFTVYDRQTGDTCGADTLDEAKAIANHWMADSRQLGESVEDRYRVLNSQDLYVWSPEE